jgi:chromosome segregation ATPase
MERLIMHELMHVLRRMERKLNALLRHARKNELMETEMAQDMEQAFKQMTDKVEKATTVMESAEELIQGLADEIRNNHDDPTAMLALADKLDAKTQELSQKITANTPNPEPPGPTPSGM